MTEGKRRPPLPELDAEELALLAAFRDTDAVPAAVRTRVRARVLETASPAPAPVVRGPWQPWVVGASLAVAAAAVLTVALGRADVEPTAQSTPQEAIDAVESPPQRQAVEVPPTPAPPPPTAPPTATTASSPAPTSAPDAPPAAPRRPASRPRPASPPEPAAASSLAEETRLLERARKAVAAGEPNRALTLLDDARERFPQGVLLQERAALRVLALCEAGKTTQGRKAAAAFLRRYPGSAHRGRVEAACPE